MRYLTLTLAALALSGCALLQATAPAEMAREKFVDGLAVYCQQPLVVRLQNRQWINENSPHKAEVTCAGDELQPPS